MKHSIQRSLASCARFLHTGGGSVHFCTRLLTLLLMLLGFTASSLAQNNSSDTPIFYESFDNTKGTGGNDGSWSGSIAISNILYDNTGWTLENAGGASKCVKLGSSKKGSAETPALSAIEGTVDCILTFKAGAWNGNSEKLGLNISISGDGSLDQTSVTLVKAQWTEYTIYITGATSATKIKFEAAEDKNNRFFLDEVLIVEDKPGVTPDPEPQDPNLTITGEEEVTEYVVGTEYMFSVNSPEGVTVTWEITAPEGYDNTTEEAADEYFTFVPNVAGEYTIKASTTATSAYNAGEATLTITVSEKQVVTPDPELQDPELSITSEDDVTEYVVGEEYTFSVNSPEGATVTWTLTAPTGYDSSSEEAADEYFVFTPNVAGEYIIKASTTATSEYNAGEATLTITVIEQVVTPDPESARYRKVMSQDELLNNGVYLIVYEDGKKAFGQISNKSAAGVDVVLTDNVATVETENSATNAYEITITRNAGEETYTLTTAAGTIHINKADLSYSDATKVTITINSDGTAQVSATDVRAILYSTGTNSFKHYATSNLTQNNTTYHNISLYRKEGTGVDDREEATATFGVEEFTFDMGSTPTSVLPTFTTNSDGKVTYESSDEGVARVDDEGEITVLGTGEVEITATVASTSTYKLATATLKLTVINTVSGGGAEDDDVTFDFTNFDNITTKWGIAWGTNDSGKELTGSGAQIRVGVVSMSWTDGGTKTRFWLSNGKYELRMYKAANSTSTAGSIIFTADEGYEIVDAEIECNNNSYTKTLSDGVLTYTASATVNIQNVTLTVRSTSTPTQRVTIGAAGLSTFCSKNALDFSGVTNVRAYVAQSVDADARRVVFAPVTGTVAGGTGLLLMGTPGTEADIAIVADGREYDESENMLRPAYRGTLIPGSESEGNPNHTYVFGRPKDGEYGFYRLTGTGMTSTGNLAYLTSGVNYLENNTSGVRGLALWFDDGLATDIENAIADVEREEGIYNLSGQRLNDANRPGMYIIGGRKVIIR